MGERRGAQGKGRETPGRGAAPTARVRILPRVRLLQDGRCRVALNARPLGWGSTPLAAPSDPTDDAPGDRAPPWECPTSSVSTCARLVRPHWRADFGHGRNTAPTPPTRATVSLPEGGRIAGPRRGCAPWGGRFASAPKARRATHLRNAHGGVHPESAGAAELTTTEVTRDSMRAVPTPSAAPDIL